MINLLLWLSLLVSDMNKIRDLFISASEDESKNIELLNLTQGYTVDYSPVVYAYHAAAEMIMAKHVILPTSKLSFFNSGKKKLEMVINRYPNLVEIRYIRYAVQKGAPSFLDYQANMSEDRKFVLANYKKMNWSKTFKSTVFEVVKEK